MGNPGERAPYDYDAALSGHMAKLAARGVTHVLFVPSDDPKPGPCALIGVDAVYDVWRSQRDAVQVEIDAGRERRANFVENGAGPTLWLGLEEKPGRAAVNRVLLDALWTHPAVTVLSAAGVISSARAAAMDSLDDLLAVDESEDDVGSDQPSRKVALRSYVQRDPEVRRRVRGRAVNGCENPGCEVKHTYRGFLDVHHVFGVENSDREWTCVALCPNCHRAAHWSPEAEALNRRLVEEALRLAGKQRHEAES